MNAVAVIAALAALAGCIRDDYLCSADSDCNLGVAGRCEIDHHCSSYDPSCTSSNRRYSSHAGAVSNQCFDDAAAPENPCAVGLPPATPTGCMASVCAALPTCCETGWSDACVQAAQRTCGIACDTRIAITASKGALVTSLWDLRYDGVSKWTAIARDDRSTLLVWLAPKPGTTEPRLAGFAAGNKLAVESSAVTLDVQLGATNTYLTAASLDVDRDGRDSVVLTYQDNAAPPNNFVEIVKLDVPSAPPRDIPVRVSVDATWGDYDGDAFPDGVASLGAGYELVQNIEADDHTRTFGTTTASGFSGTKNGAGEPATRAFAFADLNADGTLDLAAFGRSFRVHITPPPAPIPNYVLFDAACSPPAVGASPCNDTTEIDTTFAGTALQTSSATELAIATSPQNTVWLVSMLRTNAAKFTQLTGIGSDPILAIVARDLDGDGAIDLAAIDASLHVYAAFAKDAAFPTFTVQSVAGIDNSVTYNDVHVSISGAPR